MKKHIIVINGVGGSGKDTFVAMASKYTKIMNFSSVDKVKEIAKLIGWNGTKEEKDRKFLSDLKKLTTEYNDMAFNDMKEKAEIFRNSENEVMFIHIREPEEIKKAVLALKAETLLIRRNSIGKITSNYSDASVENYNYDYIIENNSTLEELENKAQKFLKDLS